MKINIKATSIELTPAIREFAEEKIGMLGRLLPAGNDELLVNVEIGRDTEHHRQGDVYRAEIRLLLNGKQLYAVENAADLYAAIDLVKDEMSRVIKTSAEKRNTLLRRGGRRVKEMLRRFNPWRN